jgi:hypothetical protein
MTSTSLSHTHPSSLSVKETHSQRRCHCLRTSSPASSNTEAAIHEGKLQTSPRSPTPLNITHSTPHLRLVPIEGSAPPLNQPPRWQHRLAPGATPLSRVSSDLPSCDLKLACRHPKRPLDRISRPPPNASETTTNAATLWHPLHLWVLRSLTQHDLVKAQPHMGHTAAMTS